MSGKAVKSAIDALDGTVTGSAGAGKTLTAFSQTDGKVSATFGNISITKSQISDFPTIPTVNNATLTIQKNGTTVKTFTANASSNVTANITASRTIKVTASSVSSLPLTISNSAIATNMECINAVLSNPSAQTGDWTCNTDTAGKVVISGTISGTTDITLYLTEV
jgi:hypothetical protein